MENTWLPIKEASDEMYGIFSILVLSQKQELLSRVIFFMIEPLKFESSRRIESSAAITAAIKDL